MNKAPENDDLALDELPEWARKALSASAPAAAQAAPSVLGLREDPAWPLLVDAAVVSAFRPHELAPGAAGGASRREAEKAVLAFSETTHAPGATHWSLTAEARRAVLGAAIRAGDLLPALERTASTHMDPLSSALRDCLQGQAPALAETADLPVLEAARVAVGWLSGGKEASELPSLRLPSLDDLDREIELRRLMAPFERMVGKVPGGGDRFFGRDGEMKRLRHYVGEVEVGRLAAAGGWVRRKMLGTPPLVVWGIGGVGKTTLIAKFMLEHARAAASHFPFAYLDFDRPTVSARSPAGLLAEMCLQVGAQFPELTGPMTALRTEVRQLAHQLEASPEGELPSLVRPHARRFRELVDGHLDALESRFEFARPFLLVLDTFEIVQYSPPAVVALEEFVRAFSGGKRNEPWPRLRLIISGRKQVDVFLEKVDALELGALDFRGSAEMLVALARDAGKSTTHGESERLVRAIAKTVGGRTAGVHPLRLRLIGDVFRQVKDADGPAVVRLLLEDLKRPLTAGGGLAGPLLVDGILVRRVLDHVTDPRVRALADPGLVVRHITPDVIRAVMTRVTPDPAKTRAADPRDDPAPAEPWAVDEAQARDIFEAFRREVTLVEDDGDALRHRADVRREMLPLIRARRPKSFAALHELAYGFFRGRVERDPRDLASAAEAVYHGLWSGEPVKVLDAIWRGPSFDPRIDPEEFDPGSLQNVYVRARAKNQLHPDEVRLLPRETALEWMAARRDDLLRERQSDEALDAIRVAAGEGYAGLDGRPELAAVVARLLYRGGLWREAAELVDRHLERAGLSKFAALHERYGSTRGRLAADDEALLSLLRTGFTVMAKTRTPLRGLDGVLDSGLYGALDFASRIRDPIVRVEVLAHLAIDTPGKKGPGHVDEVVRVEIRRAVDNVPEKVWSREPRILRLAILTGGPDVGGLLPVYLDCIHRPPRDPELVPVVARLLLAVDHDVTLLMRKSGEFMAGSEELDALWSRNRGALQKLARDRPETVDDLFMLLIYQHSDWILPLGNALSRAIGRDSRGVILQELHRHDLLSPSIPRKRGRRELLDGHKVVQWAVENGRLLDVARTLRALGRDVPKALREELGSESPYTSGPQWLAYPQTVFELADALLRWHEALLELTGARPKA